jgi:arylformamidase
MIKNKKNIFLSYILDEYTPTYGNRDKFKINKISNIKKGDSANNHP